jgi:hypothetical protein
MTKEKDLQKALEENKQLKALQNVFNKIKPIKEFEVITIPKSKKQECTAITQLGDVHYEEIVDPEVVNQLNEYNPNIAEHRVMIYFKRLLYLVEQCRAGNMEIKQLVLHLGGDFISGYIHPELQETNAMAPPRAIKRVFELLATGIKSLAELGKFKKIIVVCSTGNHGRTTEKKRTSSGRDNSFEQMLYWWLADKFSNSEYSKKVQFLISNSEFIYLDIYGYINMFSHGDHFKYNGGVGGIEVGLKKAVQKQEAVKHFDMWFINHWHQYLLSNKVRINGPVIGYSSFSRAHSFPPEVPQQQFQILDSKRGFTLNNPIILKDF